MYTNAQIDDILSTAQTSLYRVQNQSERERYMDGDTSFKDEPLLIYSLYYAVKWGREKNLSSFEFRSLAAYLFSKCEKALAGLGGVTNPGATPPTGGGGTQTQIFFWEFFVSNVPSPGFPVAGDTVWVNENFVNRTVEVELAGLPVPGIPTTDGSTYFTKSFSSNTLRFFNLSGGLTNGALLKVRAFAPGS